MIVCNKVDKENEREVTKKELKDWCDSQNLPFFETSAKDCNNYIKFSESSHINFFFKKKNQSTFFSY